MLLLPHLDVVLPRLVMKEVSRNLSEAQAKALYLLLSQAAHTKIIDEPVPADLVAKYITLGLPGKADAFIGAFVEWQGAQYLISDNRHFLTRLAGAPFEVLTPEEFLRRYYQVIVRGEGKESND